MKDTYKKMLMNLRNYYIDLNNKNKIKIDEIYDKSIDEQIEFLNKITFNLISSNNRFKSSLGNFIAYNIFRKKTYKNLIYITLNNVVEVQRLEKSIEFYSAENEKIMNTIDFINSVSDSELNKYLSYKMN